MEIKQLMSLWVLLTASQKMQKSSPSWLNFYFAFNDFYAKKSTLYLPSCLLNLCKVQKNSCHFEYIRHFRLNFCNGHQWEIFSSSGVWNKTLLAPTIWWYMIISVSIEIWLTRRYFNIYVYLKFRFFTFFLE